jgi:hypothetical protein
VSTRSTLWHDDRFHLYREAFDDVHVYLEITTEMFESLILKIPLDAWREMRKQTIEPAERYSYLTDAELWEEAEREVDKHRAWLAQEAQSPLSRVSGLMLFGSPESTREEMIENFLNSYRPTFRRERTE